MLAVTVLLLVVPGAVALRLAGAGGLVVLGAAGPLTLSTIVVAGVVAGAVGVPWTPVTLGGVVVLLWLVAAGVGRLRRRPDGPEDGGRRGSRADGLLLAGALVAAAVLGAWPSMAAMDAPNSLPQSPDTIFHVGTIQSMLLAQDVSTLHAVDFLTPGREGFYPAAFHAVAVTVVQLGGAQVDVAANAVSLVAGSVLWPAGAALLAAVVLGRRTAVLVAAPVVSVVFVAFPTWLSGYGVLWPNVLGQAVLPAALAVGLLALAGPRRWACWVLFAVLCVGLAAAHPNTVFGLVVVGGVAAGWRLLVLTVTADRPRNRVLAAGTALVLLLGTGAVWAVATKLSTAMRASNPPGPETSLREAVIDVLAAAPREAPGLWLTGAVVLVGAVLTLRRARSAWVPMAWLVVGTLYVLNMAVDSPTTRLLTWPWFNNAPRLAGLLVVPMTLLATAALAGVARLGTSAVAARPWRGVAVTTAFVVATLGGNAAARADVLEPYYPVDARATWVSRTDLTALEDLGRDLPPGAVVAANPWRGGSYLALVADDVRMLFPTEKTLGADPVQRLLGAHLDEARSDPEVCSAVTARRVGWALTGGTIATNARRARTQYVGVDGLEGASGWEKVRASGPYTLYRFAGCGTGAPQD